MAVTRGAAATRLASGQASATGIGQAPGEQFEQDRPEAEDIALDRRARAALPFGCGIGAGQRHRRAARCPARLADWCGGALFGLVADQPGNPEIEQFHTAIGRDQDVRRLQIGVNDQLAVGILDHRTNIEKQPQPRLEVEVGRRDILGHRLPLDMVHDQKRPVLPRPAIKDAADPDMVEPREDASFEEEAFLQAERRQPAAHQLDRHRLRKQAVVAFAAQHHAHAAAAEHPGDRKGADAVGRAIRLGRPQPGAFGRHPAMGIGIAAQQPLDHRGQVCIAFAQRTQRLGPRRFILQVEQLFDMLERAAIAVGIGRFFCHIVCKAPPLARPNYAVLSPRRKRVRKRATATRRSRSPSLSDFVFWTIPASHYPLPQPQDATIGRGEWRTGRHGSGAASRSRMC